MGPDSMKKNRNYLYMSGPEGVNHIIHTTSNTTENRILLISIKT